MQRDNLLESFHTDGYVVWRHFLSDGEVAGLIAQVERFIEELVPRMPPEQVFYDDKSNPNSLKQIQQMWQHDPWFYSQMTEGRFPELAQLLLGGPVVPKNMQYFNKAPGLGQPTPPHQDGYYFMLDPCLAVTMWLALDEVDEENGCVRYVTGSHRKPMRRHQRTRTLGFSQGITDYPRPEDTQMEVPLLACPGDLLVHDAMTIHRADGNQSPTRSRRALGLIYYSRSAKEDAKAHAEYQRRLAEEMKAQGKI